MNKMVKFLSFIFKIIILLLTVRIIYIEYICYILNALSWNKLICINEKTCVRILLVADPQLIGENNEKAENNHLVTPFSIWDSDRYLHNTYLWAVGHVQPDVIIFLGDLFDEGFIATDNQFKDYSRRFYQVFNTEKTVQHIWLPGDNDIGGEIEYVSKKKLKMFTDTFPQDFEINVKFIKFTKINRMMSMFDYKRIANYYNSHFFVALSHMPMVLLPALFVDKVLEILNPKIIFSAHEHKAMIIDTDKKQTWKNITKLHSGDNKIFEIQLNNDILHEIAVPTCSYRMGTSDIGFGAAVIDESLAMKYTVLWSPLRFNYIYSYIYLLFVILLFLLIIFIKKCCKIIRISIRKREYSYYRVLKNV